MLVLPITRQTQVASNTAVGLCAVVDDFMDALSRTQHDDSPAGNVLEAQFDLRIGKVTNSDDRVGSPAADSAGPSFAVSIRPPSNIPKR